MTEAGTIFQPATRDMGHVKGLGQVTLREATVGDLWPHMGDGMSSGQFPLRVLAASLLINGQQVTFEQLTKLGMRHFAKLQKMLPAVMEINGMNDAGGDADEEDEEDEENPPKGAAA